MLRCFFRLIRSRPWPRSWKRHKPTRFKAASDRLQSARPPFPDAILMTLALSLPAVEARPAHPPETRPARVQPWLEETLKRDPIEAAATIGDALAATNRVALSEARRMELAERYYATSLTLWPHLERHFT